MSKLGSDLMFALITLSLQVGALLFESMPQEIRARMWFVMLENPALAEALQVGGALGLGIRFRDAGEPRTGRDAPGGTTQLGGCGTAKPGECTVVLPGRHLHIVDSTYFV